jgi:hypothetical protein
MPTITFDVPEGALSALRLSPTEFVKEMCAAALARQLFPLPSSASLPKIEADDGLICAVEGGRG